MDYASGTLGQGGNIECTVALAFCGALGEAFVDFAVKRAARLSLRGWISQSEDMVEIRIKGPEALIDAFEIVCSLGPISCNVEEWTRQDCELTIEATEFRRLAGPREPQ